MFDSHETAGSIQSLPPVSAWRFLAAFALAGSTAGWAGQRVWSGWAILAWILVW